MHKTIFINRIQIIKNFLNLLIVGSLLILFIFISLNISYPKIEINTDQIDSCEISKYQILNTKDYIYDFEEISFLSNIGNLKCLSKIAWIQIGDDGQKKIYISSSLNVFRPLSYIFNGALSLLALFYIKQLKQELLIAYFSLNTMLIALLVSYETMWRVFIPFNLPNNKQDLFWGLFLFLYVYLLKIKSKYILWILISLSLIFDTSLISILLLLFYIFKYRDNQV